MTDLYLENFLLDKVKEQGIVQNILLFKKQMEKADLLQRIQDNVEEIENYRQKILKLHKIKDSVIKKSLNVELKNTKIPFYLYTGEFTTLNNDGYLKSVKGDYYTLFKKYCYENMKKMRMKNLELHIEYELKYGEEERKEKEKEKEKEEQENISILLNTTIQMDNNSDYELGVTQSNIQYHVMDNEMFELGITQSN